MAGPDREAIDTFMSITGVSEAIAIRKLEEVGGNLNEAVNAHFNEGDRNQSLEGSPAAIPYDFMDVDDPVPSLPPTSSVPYLPSNPFNLLDPSIENIFGTSSRAPRAPFVSHPREVREVPIEVKSSEGVSHLPDGAPSIEDVTDTLQEHATEAHETVTIDDEDDGRGIRTAASTGISLTSLGPSAPTVVDVPDSDDIEEEMIRAAIEASKRDVAMESQSGNYISVEEVFQPKVSGQEDAEIARAVSMSLQTAGQRKTISEEERNIAEPSFVNQAPVASDAGEKLPNGRHSRMDAGSSEPEDLDDLPLVRRRRLRVTSSHAGNIINVDDIDPNPPSSPRQQQNREGSFPTSEWGGISSEEHDEAVMLEAAMFGGIPETGGYRLPFMPHQLMQNGSTSLASAYPGHAYRPPSPSLAAQRLIREQQDDEYLASLQADQEKELKAKEEAEAALAEERQKEAELARKLQEEQENERQLAMKEASLPQEPAADDEMAVTLLVRMPDGNRTGRRFSKSDTLQSVFNFLDVGRVVKPGSYRLVRPYPRRAFGNEDGASTLHELGLTLKQEALYLELI